MEMRELMGDDIFMVMSILGKLELLDELVKVFEEGSQAKKKLSEAEIEARGMKVMASILQQVFKNIGSVRVEINTFLADLTGKNVDEIRSLKVGDYTKLVADFIKKPELKEVFTLAVSLMQDGTASTN